MKLLHLPNAGEAPWSARTGYVIYEKTFVLEDVVVLGRETVDGRETDWFVAVYDHDGRRRIGSGSRSTPSLDRAKELFDTCAAERRKRRPRKERAA